MDMPIYQPFIKNLKLNEALPYVMHVDMNSFFASCEQQLNPLLRNKPVAVVPYLYKGSAILAASVEAKKLGIKTGTKIYDAQEICPTIHLCLADPDKYRYISRKVMKVFKKFSPEVHAKSIDEGYLNFCHLSGQSILGTVPNRDSPRYKLHQSQMKKTANEIKQEIKEKVGDYLKCSIGVGPNIFLAKMASNVNKPDGFFYVDHNNLTTFYDMLSLQDLHGVAVQITKRLNKINIFTPNDFLNADLNKLKSEFKLFGYHWYLRLRGFEIDDVLFKRKNIGHSYHLQKFTSESTELLGIIQKLSEKTVYKMQKFKYKARCFSVYLLFTDNTKWSKIHRFDSFTNNNFEIFKRFKYLFQQCPEKHKKVKIIMISSSFLQKNTFEELDLFGTTRKQEKFCETIYQLNKRWGTFTVYPANLVNYKQVAQDRIAFGN